MCPTYTSNIFNRDLPSSSAQIKPKANPRGTLQQDLSNTLNKIKAQIEGPSGGNLKQNAARSERSVTPPHNTPAHPLQSPSKVAANEGSNQGNVYKAREPSPLSSRRSNTPSRHDNPVNALKDAPQERADVARQAPGETGHQGGPLTISSRHTQEAVSEHDPVEAQLREDYLRTVHTAPKSEMQRNILEGKAKELEIQLKAHNIKKQDKLIKQEKEGEKAKEKERKEVYKLELDRQRALDSSKKSRSNLAVKDNQR